MVTQFSPRLVSRQVETSEQEGMVEEEKGRGPAQGGRGWKQGALFKGASQRAHFLAAHAAPNASVG